MKAKKKTVGTGTKRKSTSKNRQKLIQRHLKSTKEQMAKIHKSRGYEKILQRKKRITSEFMSLRIVKNLRLLTVKESSGYYPLNFNNILGPQDRSSIFQQGKKKIHRRMFLFWHLPQSKRRCFGQVWIWNFGEWPTFLIWEKFEAKVYKVWTLRLPTDADRRPLQYPFAY